MNKKKNSKNNNDDNSSLTTSGKITIVIFFILLVLASLFNRFYMKNMESTEKTETTETYKSNINISRMLNNIGTNYKASVTITKDLYNKSVIIDKDGNNQRITIKDFNGIKKYLKASEKLYVLSEVATLITDNDNIENMDYDLVDPKTLSQIISYANEVINVTEENYFVKRYKINLNDTPYHINGNMTVDVNYNDTIQSVLIDAKDYYNKISNAYESQVIYYVKYSEINNIKLEEFALYNIENDLQ